MNFSGIDLHSNNSVVVVSDEEDRIVYRKRLPNDLEQIQAALAPYRDELAGVVVESTYNWYFLVDGLMDAGYRVHLANTTAIKKYEGLKYSGDFADAAYLAQLLRLGLLPEGYIYPREERAGRDLGRKRMQLVRCQTMQILAIENILARQTGGRMSSNQVKRLTTEQIEELGFVPDVALAVEANRAVSETLQRQIAVLEKRLKFVAAAHFRGRVLTSVPRPTRVVSFAAPRLVAKRCFRRRGGHRSALRSKRRLQKSCSLESRSRYRAPDARLPFRRGRVPRSRLDRWP
jgi:transposase